MQAKVFAKGTNGLPVMTTEIADLSDRLPEIEITTAAFWGPLSATILWGGTVDEGYTAAEQWLGNPVEIYSPDGEWLWEGLIWTVTFGAGNRQRSRSLEGYANRVIVQWNQTEGPGEPAIAEDLAGQEIYGVIEYQHNGGTLNSQSAAALAVQVLSERNRPLYLPESGSGNTVELYCVGWFSTLGYQTYTNTTGGSVDVSAVISDMLTTKAPFLSIGDIQTSGVTVTRLFDQDETVRDLIKRVAALAPDFVFEVGQGRVATFHPSGRLDTTPTYTESADGTISDTAGARVPGYLVRPDTVLRQVDFAPISVLLPSAIDSLECVYVTETRYSTTGGLSYSTAVVGPQGTVAAGSATAMRFSQADLQELSTRFAPHLVGTTANLTSDDRLVIPVTRQYLVHGGLTIDGEVVIDGELVIL